MWSWRRAVRGPVPQKSGFGECIQRLGNVGERSSWVPKLGRGHKKKKVLNAKPYTLDSKHTSAIMSQGCVLELKVLGLREGFMALTPKSPKYPGLEGLAV